MGATLPVRYPARIVIDWGYVGRALRQYAPPVLFVSVAVRGLFGDIVLGTFGVDARTYYAGLQAFRDGLDPWSAAVIGSDGRVFHFAGAPTTLVAMLPMVPLGEQAFTAAWIAASIAAALYIVRRTGLPWWWLAFPPLVEGVAHGNPGIVLIALVLVGRPWTGALAAALKIYALLPLLGQRDWRSISLFGVATACTVLIWPDLWRGYVSSLPSITARLVAETSGGLAATAVPWLVPATLAALVWIAWRDTRAAGWLATPALWPGSQFHYGAMALPVATVLLGVIMALPIPGAPAVAVVAYAIFGSRSSAQFREARARAVASERAAPLA